MKSDLPETLVDLDRIRGMLPAGWTVSTWSVSGPSFFIIQSNSVPTGYVTINTATRMHALGIVKPFHTRIYSGRAWKKRLIEDAIHSLKLAENR